MIPTQPQSDRIGTDGATDYQVTVTISNDGDADDSRTVELLRDGTTVDSQSVALNAGQSTQITLTETDIDDSSTPFDSTYTVDTGNRRPQVEARIVRSYLIDGTTSSPTTVPSQEVGRLDFQQNGVLALNQTDEINFHN